MTFASSWSRRTSSCTLSTLMPAARFGGSSTFRTESLGATWTPSDSGVNSSIGFFFAALVVTALLLRWRGRLFGKRWLLWTFVFAVGGAFAANQLGWVAAEVGDWQGCGDLVEAVDAGDLLGQVGFAFEVEMIAICLREGWQIAWVPISTVYGDERSHIKPLRHLREFVAATARARRIVRRRPG